MILLAKKSNAIQAQGLPFDLRLTKSNGGAFLTGYPVKEGTTTLLITASNKYGTTSDTLTLESSSNIVPIRKGNEIVDHIPFIKLRRMITTGEAQLNYGLGAEVGIMIDPTSLFPEMEEGWIPSGYTTAGLPTDPANPPDPVYLWFTFCTFRTFTRQNGETYSGLGLEAKNSVIHIPYSIGYGSANWTRSTYRQYYNGTLTHRLFTKGSGTFQSCLPAFFKDACEPYNTEGSSWDKYFLLSSNEVSGGWEYFDSQSKRIHYSYHKHVAQSIYTRTSSGSAMIHCYGDGRVFSHGGNSIVYGDGNAVACVIPGL